MKFFTLPLLLSLFSTLTSSLPSHFTSYYNNQQRQHRLNSLLSSSHWTTAGATWYGDPNGAGSTGGSCGYGPDVYNYPFSAMVTAVSPNLYYSGEGCGACYKIKCSGHKSCSNKPVTVALTDSCLGCVPRKAQFDMSGRAFGAMAKPGQANSLRDAGEIQIQYKRTTCNFGRTKLTFKVDGGSNPYYLAVAVEYENGDGDLSKVEMWEGNYWAKMDHSWGAVWKINSYTGQPLEAPFSFRLTAMGSDEAPLVVTHAIPRGWLPGYTYRSLVNFHV